MTVVKEISKEDKTSVAFMLYYAFDVETNVLTNLPGI